MISAADLNDPQEGQLVVVSAGAGSAPADLLPGYEGHVTGLAWLDLGRLMFLGDEGTATTLNLIGADSRGRIVLARSDGAGGGSAEV